jgi:hypothetical protein
MKRTRLAAVAAVVIIALSAGPASAGGILQPGAYHETDEGGCTLNFLFDGTGSLLGKVYFATAAHCAGGVGDQVRDIDGDVFGTVAFIGDADVTETDYAFIQVLSSAVSRTSPRVAGHPGYPTGYTTASQTMTGDRIQFSGYGLGFDLTGPTRQSRFGVLTFDDDEIWGVAGPMNFGDSGGPLVHIPTGRALGIESRVCLGVCTDEGPTIQGVLAKASAAGFTVALRPAP